MRQRRIKNLDEKLDVYSGGIHVDPKALKGRWKDIFEKDQPIYLELGCGKGRFIRKLAAEYPDRNYIAVEGNGSVLLRALQRLAREQLHRDAAGQENEEKEQGEDLVEVRKDGMLVSSSDDPSYTPPIEEMIPYGIFAVDTLKAGVREGERLDSPWRSAQSDCLFSAAPNLVFANMYIRRMQDCFAVDELSGIYLNFSDPWPKARQANRRLTHRNYLEGYRQVMPSGCCMEFKTDNEKLFRFSIEEFEAAGLQKLEYTEDLHGEGSHILSARFMTEYEERFSSRGDPIYYCKVRFEK